MPTDRQRVYVCGDCKAELELERVRRIARVRKPGKNRIRMTYSCCEEEDMVRDFNFVSECLLHLVGELPLTYPWENRLYYREDIDDSQVAAWAWELDQLADVDEFHWWVETSSKGKLTYERLLSDEDTQS